MLPFRSCCFPRRGLSAMAEKEVHPKTSPDTSTNSTTTTSGPCRRTPPSSRLPVSLLPRIHFLESFTLVKMETSISLSSAPGTVASYAIRLLSRGCPGLKTPFRVLRMLRLLRSTLRKTRVHAFLPRKSPPCFLHNPIIPIDVPSNRSPAAHAEPAS